MISVKGNLVSSVADAVSGGAVAGLGLVLAPLWLTGAEIERGELRPVLQDFTPDPADTPVYAVHPQQRLLPPKVRVFIGFLVERFGQDAVRAGG